MEALRVATIPGIIPAVRGGLGADATHHGGSGGGRRLTEELIGKFGYVGIALILILGGLGLPIPEEAPIILAAVLTRNGKMVAPLALATCLIGVIVGDFVVYLLGYFYGEKVLRLPMTRRVLTRQREAQIKGYFHRHGFKILVSGRLMPGFRTAAYLTAGILKLPAVKLLLTDLFAATFSTLLMFGLGFLFANQIQKGIHEVQQWFTLIAAVGLASWLLYRYYRAMKRGGQPVGPPVADEDEVALPRLGESVARPQEVPVAMAPALADGGPPETASPETTSPETAPSDTTPPDHPTAAMPADPGQCAAELDLGPPAQATTVPTPSR
jgi:membrane protein DedA with SNARE-associated domain